MARVGLRVRPQTLVRNLSVAQMQMVEIARALHRHVRVLILDEPTRSLSEHETAKLFEIIDVLRQQGVGIVYISHRLAEVFQIAQQATVLRDGQVVGTLPIAEASEDTLLRMMVGRELSHLITRARLTDAPVRLDVQDLSKRRVLHDISFQVRGGEIVGFAGLVGSARFPSRARERALVAESIQSFRIRTPHMEQRVGALSGRNQQRVVIARWLATKPKVLILDEPTHGIDEGAKAEVHALFARLPESGAAIS